MTTLLSWLDGPITVIAVIVAIAGGCVVAFGHGLTFDAYIQDIGILLGLTAVGRGVAKHGRG